VNRIPPTMTAAPTATATAATAALVPLLTAVSLELPVKNGLACESYLWMHCSLLRRAQVGFQCS